MVNVLQTGGSADSLIKGITDKGIEVNRFGLNLFKTAIEYLQSDIHVELGTMTVLTNNDGEPNGNYGIVVRENPGSKIAVPGLRAGLATVIRVVLNKLENDNELVCTVSAKAFRSNKEYTTFISTFTELCIIMTPINVTLIMTDMDDEEDNEII
mgnify:CR=1 FL=1|jgi:hypothetical protein